MVATGEKTNGGANRTIALAPMNSGSLSIYERMDPLSAVKLLGAAIAKSGMFGVNGEKQGEILALECLVRKMPPLMLKETYHVIHNNLSMRAEKMLSNFNEGGGKHKIISRDGELASIEMTLGNEKQTFSLSWEEAKQEPFVYNGKESVVVELLTGDEKKRKGLKVKDKYATPRARSQMMWARVVSDGVRAMMPSAICGCYTPEEIGDFNDGGAVVPAQPGTVAADFSQGEVVDGEFQVTETGSESDDSATSGDEPTLADSAEVVAEVPANPEFCTAAQSSQINDLFAALGMNADQIAAALKKRGANNNRSLKFEAAAELITTLEGVKAKKLARAAADAAAAAEQAAADEQATVDATVGESRKSEGTAFNLAGPATQEQVEEAKKSLKELNQVDKGMFNRWVAHMRAKGLQIADLSAEDCQIMIVALQKKTLDRFFELSLEKWVEKNGGNNTVADKPKTADGLEVSDETRQWQMRDLDDDELLRPLIDQHGHSAVWDACETVNGCPPTWQLSGIQKTRVAEFFSGNKV